MLCKRCRVVMETTGTTYEQKRGKDKTSHKRFCECKKCGDRVYTDAPNFQEMLVSEK